MSRIKVLEKQVHKILKEVDGNHRRAMAAAHLHGVSLAAVIIAKKRGEDPELAAMAGLLHDLYAYKSGSYKDHAHKGAVFARSVLEELEITDSYETEIICHAIWNHRDKDRTDYPMDEVLKDADVIHHSLQDPSKEVLEHEKKRYQDLCGEFGLM